MITRTLDLSDRRRLFWQLQAIGWGATLLLSFGVTTHYWPTSHVLLLAGSRALFGLGVTSLLLRPIFRHIRHLRQRQPPHSWPGWMLPGLVGLGVLLGMADAAVTIGVIRFFIGELPEGTPVTSQLVWVSIIIRCFLYVSWSALYFIIHYWLDTQRDQLRMAQAEAALRASELQLLRAQVNPHFLFNALNSILAVSSQPTTIQSLTLALADYLRFSLRQRGDTDQLGVELEALENYLQVEKVRFGDNLQYTISASPAARETAAPVALLQPLLENAIKYGQRSSIRPVKLKIVCSRHSDTLVVAVHNTGPWVEPSASSSGIGLHNLRRRLGLLYGPQATLEIAPQADCVCVRVSLPACPSPLRQPAPLPSPTA